MDDKSLILVVDDNPYMLKAHLHVLESEGFETIQAATGKECLSLVEEKKPDLILLDVNLPDMNGRDVCKQIKENPASKDIFIAHISAVARTEDDQIRGLDSGADAYITLPISPKELIARIKSLIRIKDAQKKILESEGFLKEVLYNISSGVLVVNMEGRIVLINKAAGDITGFSEKDVIGIHMAEIFDFSQQTSSGVLNIDLHKMAFTKENIIFECRTQPGEADEETCVLECSFSELRNKDQKRIGAVLTFDDITEKKKIELEKTNLIKELKQALDNIKKLSGLLPICASCKKIRDDSGYWEQVEVYVRDHSEAEFSHSLCPECIKKLYPDLLDEDGSFENDK